jgi:transcriptional regulator with XRE-family HTH domain
MFTNKIRERRQQLGLSQTQLARLISVPGSALSDFELGKRPVGGKAKRALTKVLACPEEQLFPPEG